MKHLQKMSSDRITVVTQSVRESIAYLLGEKGGVQGLSAVKTAQYIRPYIGLNRPQTIANKNFYNSTLKNLRDNNPDMSKKAAEERARFLAKIKAEKQHRYRATMIARTELANSYNVAHHLAVEDASGRGLLGDMVKLWCTSDGERMCEVCGRMEGEVREVKEFFSCGLLYPTLHPHCMCVVLYEDRFLHPSLGSGKTTTALPSGNRGLLPDSTGDLLEDISSVENSNQGLPNSENHDRMREAKTTRSVKQPSIIGWNESFVQMASEKTLGTMFDITVENITDMTEEYQIVVSNKFSNGTEIAQKVLLKYLKSDAVATGKLVITDKTKNHFNPNTKKISMNFEQDRGNSRGAGTTFFHEVGHYVDYFSGKQLLQGGTYGGLLKKDFNNYVAQRVNDYMLTNNKGIDPKTIQRQIGREELQLDLYHAISDLFHGLSNGRCKGLYGHNIRYWATPQSLEKEAFAHMFEAQFEEKKKKVMKQYFPYALDYFEDILERI